MVRNILLASVIALGAAGAAQAADGPRLIGGLGDGGARIERSQPATQVGGATVLFSGGGNDRSYAYGAVQAQPGRVARIIGGGNDQQVVYEDAPQAAGLAAAALVGAPRG